MRIVSYNILDGGEGRADPLAEVLLAHQAAAAHARVGEVEKRENEIPCDPAECCRVLG